MHETDVPAERAQTRQDARVPQADVDQGRPSGDPGTQGEGAAPAVRVSRRAGGVEPIRSRRTFERLRRPDGRGRSGPLSVRFVAAPPGSRPQVAYAVGRQVGGAVDRNRLRRRLRAIVAEQAPALPAGAYVIGAGPGGPELEFEELRVAMGQAIGKATSGEGRPR
jgi:ribonuclease P protein component